MNIFKIKKEERILAISTVLICTALHVLLILSYPTNFFKAGKLGFWSIFYKHFTVSGFDAYSYIFLSNEKIYYELSRHPLFSILLYPGYWLNQLLMDQTSRNCATYIMAVMLVAEQRREDRNHGTIQQWQESLLTQVLRHLLSPPIANHGKHRLLPI